MIHTYVPCSPVALQSSVPVVPYSEVEGHSSTSEDPEGLEAHGNEGDEISCHRGDKREKDV